MLFLFDVDGTLTPPRSFIKDDMINYIKYLRTIPNLKLGIVGGSDLEKIKSQIGSDMLNYFDYVFKEDINLNDDVISQHLGINKFRDNPRIKRHRFIAKKLYTPCNCKWAYKTNCSDNKCTKI